MAKSSRSKWKRQHRRILASKEKKNVDARLSRLHKKLELTVKGAITAVPLQDPETRFHFVNPAVKQKANDLSLTNLNTNTKLDVQLYGVEDSSRIDFSKPLQLPPPTTNYYGKSDPNAPHPMTVNYESLDGEAPVAGHALTKENMAWLAKKAQEEAAARAAKRPEDEEDEDEDGPVTMTFDVSGDAPEEYAFDTEDTAPRRVTSSHASSESAKKKPVAAAAAAAKSTKKAATKRVKAVDGNAKMKAVGGAKGAGASRIVSSGSKASLKAKKGKK